MIWKRLITIYLPALAVLSIIGVASVMLYKNNDPKLEEVKFVESPAVVSDTAPPVVIEESVVTPDPIISATPNSEPTPVVEPKLGVINSVIVTISGPGVAKRCEVTIKQDKTVQAVMLLAAEQCNFSYQWEKYSSLGIFVKEIAGVSSDKKPRYHWIYYVNGKLADVGVADYTVVAGDKITWQFEQDY
ncbi:MAG: DUF4430 domain-containing protein [Patescibacteria group bacterium]|jgi:hypothetical protein